jgi:hypothetical protein
MVRASAVRIVGGGAILVLLTACTQSSTAHRPTTTGSTSGRASQSTTTVGGSAAGGHPPTTLASSATNVAPPPNSSAVVSFLQGPGRAVLVFEQDTKPLGTGKAPSQPTCSTISHQLPASDSSDLLKVVNQVPDPILRYALSQDVQNKGALLGSCLSGHPSPTLVATGHKSSTTVQGLLSQLGL